MCFMITRRVLFYYFSQILYIYTNISQGTPISIFSYYFVMVKNLKYIVTASITSRDSSNKINESVCRNRIKLFEQIFLHDQFILHASQASFMVVLATTSVVQKILLNDVKLVLIYTYDQTKFVSRTILIDALA